MSESEQHGLELLPVLGALRRPGHEAQFTQVIAAVAGQDPSFASALATVLVDAAPHERARATLGPIPPVLGCVPEVRLRDSNDNEVGQIDLRFRDEADLFCLLAELKLHSTYGVEQLPRYLAGLAADSAMQKALVAVTTATPQFGEDAIARPDLFLGSVRWSKVFDRLHDLPHRYANTRQVWQALLFLMRQQGDFGPMDVDEEAVRAWALQDQADRQMRYWLTELLQPIIAALGTKSSTADEPAAKVLRPVVPWKGQLHAKLAVPAEVAEERLRVQFWADQRITFFDVEARYDHPTERLDQDARFDAITSKLNALGFEFGTDGCGWFWAKLFEPENWLQGADTLQRLLDFAITAVTELATSGLFEMLARLTPTSPAPGPRGDLFDEPPSAT